jgi:uncharacterized repeat protein (TIGR03803 family)
MKNQAKQLLVLLALSAGLPLARAQTLIPIYSFTALLNSTNSDGAHPADALVQGSDGYLYGTTSLGGVNKAGTVFRITTGGVLTSPYSFTGHGDGAEPNAGLVQASDGNLYGTALYGGTNGYGAIFRITFGAVTPLWSFTDGHDGANPYGGLVQASDGNLYGTTEAGGTNGYGTIFRLTTSGSLTPLWSFTGGLDGAEPYSGLVQGKDGNLYGTAILGGADNNGTVFRITTNNAFTPLYAFTRGHDGGIPYAGLVQASDGNFYGTTIEGGTNGDGTVFRITTNGIFTPLWSFTGGSDGTEPYAGLVQASDGNLYGTTEAGGTNGDGTIFRITTNNVFTPLYSFTGGHDGANPYAGLVQAANGNLYGTAGKGGTNGNGTVFEFALPPPPLNIISPNQNFLSWPGSNTNYLLQTTTNLASPNWVTVSNVMLTPAIIATVTNSLPAQYFRLANP